MVKALAAVQTAARAIEMRRLEVPASLAPGEALLQIEACGMCGSDAEQYRHGPEGFRIPGPVIPGHEPLGRIAAISPEAAKQHGVKVGDRVAVQAEAPCGVCENCSNQVSCRNGFYYGFRPVSSGSGLWGGYSEYMLIAPGTRLHRVSADLSAEDAVLFNPLAAGFGWMLESGGLRAGDTALILGPGQRGLASVVAAREAGASRIIVTGLEQDRAKLDLALEFGATDALIAGRDDIVASVRDLTGGKGVDRVIDVTPGATQPIIDGIEALRDGGAIVLGGLKSGRSVDLPVDTIVARQIRLVGVLSMSAWAVKQAIRTIEAKKYPLHRMHTHSLPIEELDLAMRLIAGEEPGEAPIHITVKPNISCSRI